MKNKVLLIGLGLIGGSIALRFKKNGYFVGGYDINETALNFGLEKGIIDEIVSDEGIKEYPFVIFALYPQAELSFIRKKANLFNEGTLVMDVTGVKAPFAPEIRKTLDSIGVRYISTHPMAGGEKQGVTYSRDDMFEGCNFIICPIGEQEEDVEEAKQFGKLIGASRISLCDVTKHDALIAFLSQLPHAIAVSLMTSCDDSTNLSSYTGDSFRDLTRIASINEKMWSELFLSNKKTLVNTIDFFQRELDKLKIAIADGDRGTIEEMMVLSTTRRKEF